MKEVPLPMRLVTIIQTYDRKNREKNYYHGQNELEI